MLIKVTEAISAFTRSVSTVYFDANPSGANSNVLFEHPLVRPSLDPCVECLLLLATSSFLHFFVSLVRLLLLPATASFDVRLVRGFVSPSLCFGRFNLLLERLAFVFERFTLVSRGVRRLPCFELVNLVPRVARCAVCSVLEISSSMTLTVPDERTWFEGPGPNSPSELVSPPVSSCFTSVPFVVLFFVPPSGVVLFFVPPSGLVLFFDPTSGERLLFDSPSGVGLLLEPHAGAVILLKPPAGAVLLLETPSGVLVFFQSPLVFFLFVTR